jgi:hypothetical protein
MKNKKELNMENIMKEIKRDGIELQFWGMTSSPLSPTKPCESVDNPYVINGRNHPNLTDKDWKYLMGKRHRLLEIINEELPYFCSRLVDCSIENFLEEMKVPYEEREVK